MSHDELVKVVSAGNQVEAEMWRELLENSGIPCMARITGPLVAQLPFASPHELLVRARDLERAQQVLAAYAEEG